MCRCHRGPFRRGPDCRRHVLTREECSRGGLSSWVRTMAELRVAMQVPLMGGRVEEYATAYLLAQRGS
jgi:hypothetical protein